MACLRSALCKYCRLWDSAVTSSGSFSRRLQRARIYYVDNRHEYGVLGGRRLMGSPPNCFLQLNGSVFPSFLFICIILWRLEFNISGIVVVGFSESWKKKFSFPLWYQKRKRGRFRRRKWSSLTSFYKSWSRYVKHVAHGLVISKGFN